MERLILASRSPRRRQLLTEWGIPFQSIPADDSVETVFEPTRGGTPHDFVQQQACAKARNVAEQFPRQDVWILGCDTVAVCAGKILGKPRDRADARRMLRQLAGSLHEVVSGLCLLNPARSEAFRLAAISTQLEMESLSEAQLEAYLDTQKWVGKAGAFGYQDGNDWLKIQSGSASNVVGLPMETLVEWLRDADFSFRTEQ